MRTVSKLCSWSWLFVAIALLPAVPAAAQATRTWVSGVGDDVNPCSRTAPCKTFAGAISKTATGGEINVLDPGAFGAVTITKSITISSEGFEAGVLATLGSSGIIINALSTSVVVLRGLDIEGAGSGANGIRFLAGAALHVEDCTINNFTGKGITFEPSASSFLFVVDTIVRNNRGVQADSGGILIKPGVAGIAQVSLDNVRMENNQFGLRADGGSTVTVTRSIANRNQTNGFFANAVGGTSVINVSDSAASHNGGNGIRSANAGATVRLSGVTITENLTAGLSVTSGAIVSLGDNFVEGNGTNGSPTSTVPPI
jgi:hypothetical protein